MSHYSYNSDEIYEIINGNINNISTLSNTNIFILDISDNNTQIIPYTQRRSICILKILYSSFAVAILVMGFIYISPYYKN